MSEASKEAMEAARKFILPCAARYQMGEMDVKDLARHFDAYRSSAPAGGTSEASVGDDDPACTCRALPSVECIKHPSSPPPATEASGEPVAWGVWRNPGNRPMWLFETEAEARSEAEDAAMRYNATYRIVPLIPAPGKAGG